MGFMLAVLNPPPPPRSQPRSEKVYIPILDAAFEAILFNCVNVAVRMWIDRSDSQSQPHLSFPRYHIPETKLALPMTWHKKESLSTPTNPRLRALSKCHLKAQALAGRKEREASRVKLGYKVDRFFFRACEATNSFVFLGIQGIQGVQGIQGIPGPAGVDSGYVNPEGLVREPVRGK